MKRLIIITILLLTATAMVTVIYFKNLNNTTQHTSLVLRTIPNNAALIFEFNNEKEFYDIYNDNKLFVNLLGEEKIAELAALKNTLLQNSLIEPFLKQQSIFVSLHPQKNDAIDFILTTSVAKDFNAEIVNQLAKQTNNSLVITSIDIGGKQGYTIYIKEIKKRFYLITKDKYTLAGSFSKELISAYAKYDYRKEKQAFVLLSERQSTNSLANLYVNYVALSPLFEQLFINKNIDIFKSFRQSPAFAALSINYKRDAFMFSGLTAIKNEHSNGYWDLLINQQPVVNRLKAIFPSTTAYCTSFAISNPVKFEDALSAQQAKSKLKIEQAILKKIKTETSIDIKKEFKALLGTEFAIITTRYREKIGIVQLKNGSKMRAILSSISKTNSDDSGLLNYEMLPQILLGDAFNILKRPYYKVIDNYLLFCNSLSELMSYNDSYINRKFLNKTEGYNQFDGLLTGQSNMSFFIQFRNAESLFKLDLKPENYDRYTSSAIGWRNFYGAAWQFTTSDKSYYTNFCMGLKTDTTTLKDTF